MAIPFVWAGKSCTHDLESLEKRITAKVLHSGLRVLVCERLEVPSFPSSPTSRQDQTREFPGIMGLTHLFEHMAFKGMDNIAALSSRSRIPVSRARAYFFFLARISSQIMTIITPMQNPISPRIKMTRLPDICTPSILQEKMAPSVL